MRASATKVRVALIAMLCAGCCAHASPPLVVKAAKVITLAGEALTPGMVLVIDGKIAAVGATVDAPAGAEIIDAGDGVVMPGLVAAQTSLGGSRDTRDSITPDLCVSDGLDVFGDWRRVLAGGVTTVQLSPTSGRLMPGREGVAKLSDGSPSARVLRRAGALVMVLNERAHNPPIKWDPPLPPTTEEPFAAPQKQLPTTRMGAMALLRETFRGALGGPDAKQGPAPRGLDVLRAALDGEIAVRARADRAEDIRGALALADEFGLKLIIEGGTEAHLLADEIAQRGVPVVLRTHARPGRALSADLMQAIQGQARPDAAAMLMQAGVKVAITASDESLGDLLAIAAWSVGCGAPREGALRSVTTHAADVLGVSDRTGTLEVGKDADLLILSGDPLATRTTVQATVSDGSVVYRRKSDEGTGSARGPLRIFRAREIITGNGGTLHGGEIWVRGGLIEKAGRRSEAAQGAEVVDLGDRVIMPGMIDMQSHLGLHWESEEPVLSPKAATTAPSTGAAKSVSIAYAIDPTDAAFEEALQAGVTSVVLAPGNDGLFCGTVAVVKTGGEGTGGRVVKPIAALKFSMLAGSDKLKTIWDARDLLGKAKKYEADWTEFEKRWAEFERKYGADADPDLAEPSRPSRDGKLEPLRGLFRDRLPALVTADRADEIANAVKVFHDEYGLDLTVLGARDGHLVAGELQSARLGACVGPEMIWERRGRRVNTAAALSALGIAVVFKSDSTSGTQLLRTTAAYAVRDGMDGADAVRALTARPASLLGLGQRIGCIEPGRDADLVVLSGDPLEYTSRVEKVFINGSLAYDAATED